VAGRCGSGKAWLRDRGVERRGKTTYRTNETNKKTGKKWKIGATQLRVRSVVDILP